MHSNATNVNSLHSARLNFDCLDDDVCDGILNAKSRKKMRNL